MQTKSLFSLFLFIIILFIGLACAWAVYSVANAIESGIIAAVSFIIALLVASAIKIADPWDKAVVLRLGKFQSLRGPGMFFIIPILD